MKSSPLNELNSQDIKRKQKKLMKIQEKLSDTDMNSRKQKRLKERKHKTIYQIATKDRGRPTSLKNKEWLAGEHQMGEKNLAKKSALNMLGIQPKSPLNQEYDKDYKGDANKLIEEVKNEAANYAPEYDPPPTQEQREADPNYKFFITNASDESNEVARKMDSLKYHVKFDKNKRPNLQMQKDLKKKYGLNRNTSKKKIDSPMNLNDPYAGQYEGGAGGGATYFSNKEDFQKLFDTITAAGEKLNDPEKKAARQAKYQENRAKRIGERTVKRIKKGKKGYEVTKQAHDRVTNITAQVGTGMIPNIKVERGGVDTIHGDKTKKAVQKRNKLLKKSAENKLKAAAAKKAKESKK